MDQIDSAIDKLHTSGSLCVRAPTGEPFVILVRQWESTALRSYACRRLGARRVSTRYRIMSRSELYAWIGSLYVTENA